MRSLTSLLSRLAKSLMAFCPLRNDKYPVKPTAAKICRTKGTIRRVCRDNFRFAGLKKGSLVKIVVGFTMGCISEVLRSQK